MSTLEKIQQLMRERLGLAEEQVQPGQSLEAIGIDSLAIVEFMFDLEDEFGVRLTDERTPVSSVQDIADIIDRALANPEQLRQPASA
ncbi:MAG TPA: phosphopantetheine-binding protein [Rhodocyclaceae bacterium]|nr:phosphopantetheine-binding protein [Rhodocyclaceae bacterium]